MYLIIALLIGAYIFIRIKQGLSEKRRAFVRYESTNIEQIKKDLAERETGRKMTWIEVEDFWRNK